MHGGGYPLVLAPVGRGTYGMRWSRGMILGSTSLAPRCRIGASSLAPTPIMLVPAQIRGMHRPGGSYRSSAVSGCGA